MSSTIKAVSTINTVLKCGATVGNLTKICKIKTYPDLMGAPEMIEVTDLEDTMQTFIEGVQANDAMEFTCNYTANDYAAAVQAIPSGGPQYYQLEMGASGVDGKFQWQGTHSVRISGGDVNAAREMIITCVPATAITCVTSGATT